MASLSASLLARKGEERPANRAREMIMPRKAPVHDLPRHDSHGHDSLGLGSVVLSSSVPRPLKPETKLTTARPRPLVKTADRKQKCLRLDRETDRALRMLAARDGVTQQSLMEAAVKTLLGQKSDETDCICGRGNR